MTQFHCNNSFYFVSQRDTVNFMSMLWSDSRFKNTDIFVGSSSELEDPINKLMINISINFNVIKGRGKDQIITKWQWTSFRAKDFCCSGSEFKRISE